MLLNKKFITSKKFIINLWFRYIFLSYDYLYFFNLNSLSNISFLDKELRLKNLTFKFFHKIPYFFSKNLFFNCFKFDLLLVYSNNYFDYSTLLVNHIQIFALLYRGFILNNIYLNNLNDYYLFYNENYFFFSETLSYFINIYCKLIMNILFQINFIILSLKKFIK